MYPSTPTDLHLKNLQKRVTSTLTHPKKIITIHSHLKKSQSPTPTRKKATPTLTHKKSSHIHTDTTEFELVTNKLLPSSPRRLPNVLCSSIYVLRLRGNEGN